MSPVRSVPKNGQKTPPKLIRKKVTKRELSMSPDRPSVRGYKSRSRSRSPQKPPVIKNEEKARRNERERSKSREREQNDRERKGKIKFLFKNDRLKNLNFYLFWFWTENPFFFRSHRFLLFFEHDFGEAFNRWLRWIVKWRISNLFFVFHFSYRLFFIIYYTLFLTGYLSYFRVENHALRQSDWKNKKWTGMWYTFWRWSNNINLMYQ